MRRHLKSWATIATFALAALAMPAASHAQVPTGTVSGHVTGPDGKPLGGATVSLVSESLPQPQRRTTSANGDYIFKLLPPGAYDVSIEMNGFSTIKQRHDVAANEPVVVDVALQIRELSEETTVTADAETFVNTALVASNFKQSMIDALPTARTILASVNLSTPSHDTGPDGAFTIGGAASFENVFEINGVEAQDNLRGTPLNLFVEDAIQEVTVMTSGLSSEYGRFTGGVVNAITRSGGDMFSGSYRTTLTNDEWQTVSPYGEPRVNATVPETEFTFGGPVDRSHTWFFAAGRMEDNKTGEETAFTDIPYTYGSDEHRFEAKVTQALGPNQRLEVDDIGIREDETNYAPPPVMDLASLISRQTPQNLLGVHYTASLGPHFFLESQFSSRDFAFQHSGGLSTDLIDGTPLLDQQTGATWWSPTFCGVCGDENRDNRDFTVKGTYFMSNATGAHNIVVGMDTFDDQVQVNNHQSGSDWTVWATSSEIVNGTVYPVMAGGESTFLINWPITAASQGTNFRTNSVFANDSWTMNRHLSANLGLRYDKDHGVDSAGDLVSVSGAFSPRLGVTWDPTGHGTTTVNVSAGRYLDALANSIASIASPGGVPSILAYFYGGPDINTDPTQPLVSSAAALQQVFSWYNANQPSAFQATIPGVNTEIPTTLKPPYVDEFDVGLSHELGRHGAVRVDYVDRYFGNFYALETNTSTGQVTDSMGNLYDLQVLENTNALMRRYDGVTAQGSYHQGTSLTLGASYTLSRLWGNDDAENINSGPVAASALSYPEYFDLSWSDPVGDLAADQRNRGRIWTTIALPWFDHSISLGLIEELQSGTPYGAVGLIDSSPYVQNPGYVTPPVGTVDYYFTARDAFHTAAMFRTDLSINYQRKIGHARSQPEAFVHAEVLNLLNQFQLFNDAGADINTTVLTSVTDPSLAPFNPFTSTPVQGVNWAYGPSFGKPIDPAAYTLPRTFEVSFGLKF